MRTSKCTDGQSVAVLRQAEGGTPVIALCRRGRPGPVRRRPTRRKRAATRSTRVPPTAAHQRRAMDVRADALAHGSRVRVFTLGDVFTREGLALAARPRVTGADVAAVLTRVAASRGLPPVVPCDRGTELTSLALDPWAHA